MPAYILTLSCPDRPGIVAAVSGHLFEAGYTIRDAQQFDDAESGRFFMRVAFETARDGASPDPAADFSTLAQGFAMNWAIHDALRRPKVLLLASKFDHCWPTCSIAGGSGSWRWTWPASSRTIRAAPIRISISATRPSTICR